MTRMFVRIALLLLPLSLLPVASATAQGPATVKASGNGIFFTSFGGTIRIFKFHAKEQGGEVTGKALLLRPESEDKVEVEITCITIVDSSTLLLGGTITKSTTGTEGDEVVFAVRDGGEHAADRLSPLFTGTCESDQPLDSLLVIDAGNIKVHVEED